MSAPTDNNNVVPPALLPLESTRIAVSELRRIFGGISPTETSQPLLDAAALSQHYATYAELLEQAFEPLFEREKTSKLSFNGGSPQNSLRRGLVQYMVKLGEKFHFSRTTLCLGIHLYNHFQDNHDIGRHQLYLVAVSCLYLGAKMHQIDPKCMKTLSRYIPRDQEFTTNLFLQIELLILGFFKWKLLIPTLHEFVEAFSLVCIEDMDILLSDLETTKTATKPDSLIAATCAGDDKTLLHLRLRREVKLIEGTMNDLVGIVMLEEPSPSFTASEVAAGILMLARLYNKFNRWSANIVTNTRYTAGAALHCINMYLLEFPAVITLLDMNVNYIPITAIKVDEGSVAKTEGFPDCTTTNLIPDQDVSMVSPSDSSGHGSSHFLETSFSPAIADQHQQASLMSVS